MDPNNHRGQSGVKAGPIFDIGTYPTNAARNLFGAEPIEVFATGTRHPEVTPPPLIFRFPRFTTPPFFFFSLY